MRKLLLPALMATLATATLLTAGAASPALASQPRIYTGYGYGTGPTSKQAYNAAFTNLNQVNLDCFWGTITVVYDTLQPSGIWAAEISAKCETPNTN